MGHRNSRYGPVDFLQPRDASLQSPDMPTPGGNLSDCSTLGEDASNQRFRARRNKVRQDFAV